MPIEVKICGINSTTAADAALAAGADYAGLVFFSGSPRNLNFDQAAKLAQRMRGKLKLVALVVDENDEHLGAISRRVRPDFFQLHGSETPRRAAEIAARFKVPTIKALALKDGSDVAQAADFAEVVSMFLFDAAPASGASRPGGRGAAFDWQILKTRAIARPWFLAGGLTAGNVGRAIGLSGADKVDVSSGVEDAPGIKSQSRIAEFVAAAKQKVGA